MKAIKHKEYDEILIKIVQGSSFDGINPEGISQLNEHLREGYDIIDWKFEFDNSTIYFIIARSRRRKKND